ncbi:MAG: DNA translocase FtsK [Bacteroidales bacterium]|jgi:S-DNA-T family DNA segregation ATPase FtsK/SpoIIIE|nr:DNA translocase FtsK [Bacteroidales bacterium]
MSKGSKERADKGKFYRLAHDERFKTTLAFVFIGLAVFLIVAFVSYLFTWKADQSMAEFSRVSDQHSSHADNWMGKLGAWTAFKLITNGFGLASFFIPLIFLVLGFRLLKVKLLPLLWTLRTSLIGLALLSLILGFVSGNAGGFLGSGLGGAHGKVMSDWFVLLLGHLGTAILLLLLTFVFLTFTFVGFYSWFKRTSSSVYDSVTKAKLPKLPNTVKPAKSTPAPSMTSVHSVAPLEDSREEEDSEDEAENQDEETDLRETAEDGVAFEIVQSHTGNDEPVTETPTTGDEPEQYIMDPLDAMGPYDPTLELSNYQKPPLDLLIDRQSDETSVSPEELGNNKDKIVETLGNYGIQISKIKATPGPTVTLYEIVPAAGVRISKIKNLEDDIALSLSALGIRIIAPMPGKGTIGIEVPNMNPEIVSMRSIVASKRFQDSAMELPIALGKTISNDPFVFDLTKMPHLLVAGATGQGKSVGLNAIIASILYKKHPSQVKLVMVDPKSVEFSSYEKIEHHFLAKIPDSEEAIITDTKKVIYTLNSLCIEMETRYSLLKDAEVRNIKEYNTKFIARRLNPNLGHRFLPYIVLIIDEYADLMMTAGKEIETPIARLAQKARAAGIHLIIATQRPTVSIITGTIKANFPARIAFRVIQQIDSRTILDGSGANQLIGRGDLLFTSGGELTRVQCAFIDTPEIEDITKFINKQQGYLEAFPLPEYSPEDNAEAKEVDLSKKDEYFDEAARLMVAHQQGSTSLIQRKFSIGYNRAGRLMDQLEAAGIVGASEGSKARQVLFTDMASLEQYLNKLTQGNIS